MKYVLVSEKYQDDEFEAEDDEEAEHYVEEKYTSDDGKMTLFRIEPVCSWP